MGPPNPSIFYLPLQQKSNFALFPVKIFKIPQNDMHDKKYIFIEYMIKYHKQK